MDTLEFLGGKYGKPEQIVLGPVQTFRAQTAATGAPVFVHRVSTTENQPEQAALLKLLMTAMFRSPGAKRLVLDFGEERGYWYVVTECEPKCVALREWLQFEIDNAAPASGAVKPSAAPQSPKPPGPSQAGPAQARPGEFTQFFKAMGPTPQAPQRPSGSTPPQSATSFPSQSGSQSVQRPTATPPVFTPARTNESGPGEFTRLFSRGRVERSKPAPPDLATPASDLRDIFNPEPEAPMPQPSASPQPGEFTRIFGKGDQPPPPQRPSAVAAPLAASLVDDPLKAAPLKATRAEPIAPSPDPPPPVAKSPSEYTMVIQGTPAQAPGHAPAAPPSGSPAAAASGSAAPAMSVNLQGANPAALMGAHPMGASGHAGGVSAHASPAGLSASSALGSAHIAGPQMHAPPLKAPAAKLPLQAPSTTGNKKLVIFFLVLGVLAVLLVVLVVLFVNKK